MPQKWVNNWSTALAAEALTAATTISVPSAEAAKLGALSTQDFVHLTLEGSGAVEIVRATGVSGGDLTVARGQEGTTAQDWPAGTRIEVRVTVEGLTGLREVDPALSGEGQILVGADGGVLTQTTTVQMATDEIDLSVSGHTNDTANPHGVTKAQVGLGSVLDVASYSKAEADAAHALSLKKASNLSDLADSATARANLGLGALAVQSSASGVPIADIGGNFTAANVEAALAEEADARQAHAANASNPHSVTKTQVGLGNVTNDAQLKAASNLSDLADAATARINLGTDDAANLTKGAISDATHGARAGGTLHAAATQASAGFLSPGDKVKVDRLTVTQAVDLDAIEARVSGLDAAVVLRGDWNPTSGSFPAGTAAGDSYIASADGTVDGVAFKTNDRLLSITDNASTTTYVGNWLKLDYTDQVLSVAGKTGAVTLSPTDVGLGNVTNNAQLEKAKNLSDVPDAAAARTSLGLGGLAVQSNASGVPITDAGGNFTSTDVESALAEEASARQAHGSNTSNPHNVTKTQVGLGNVLDVASWSKTEADSRFLQKTANLSDLTDVVAARTNLDVRSKVESDVRYIQRLDPLFDPSVPPPTLALSALPGVPAPSILAVARASTATYFDSKGIMRTVGNDELRADHDPVTGQFKGWLIEGDSTNLVTYSEDFSNAAWAHSSGNGAVTAGAAVAPDGSNSAYLISDNDANASISIRQYMAIASGTDWHTFSMYIKAGTSDVVQLKIQDGSNATATSYAVTWSKIDTDTPPANVRLQKMAEGWYRVSLSLQTGSFTDAYLIVWPAGYASDGIGSSYIWGAQLEAGEFPTSYIPTTSASVTRLGDGVSITGTDFTDFYNPNEGTFVCYGGGSASYAPTSTRYITVSDGTNANQYIGYGQSFGDYINSTTHNSVSTSMGSFTGYYVRAWAYSSIGAAISIDGSYSEVTNGWDMIPSASEMAIGGNSPYTGSVNLNGHIKYVLYFPRRLSNSTLQELTK